MPRYRSFHRPDTRQWAEIDWLRWLDQERLAPSVLPDDTGVCHRCRGAVEARDDGSYWPECYPCRTYAPHLAEVVPICFSLDTGLESVLAHAKDRNNPQYGWLRLPLAALFWNFMDRHWRCLYQRYGRLDLATVIPSHSTTRGGVDHLKALLSPGARWPCPADLDLLVKTATNEAKTRRSKIVPTLFQLAPERCVRGKRILLIDDTYTTGGTIASAAHALTAAGASTVVGLTIGRQLNRDFTPAEALITRVEGRRLQLGKCPAGTHQ